MKLFFCAMVGPGSLENLKELLEPIKQHFDGISIVLHDARGSEEEKYLESIKGEGSVIHLPFSRRHAFSRNHYLWCGGIPEGSWIVQCDHLERINLSFAANLRNMIVGFEAQGINTCFYYNKAFVYQQHESLEFIGSPHEGLHRRSGDMRPIELSHYMPIETEVRYSVRNIKRPDKWHFVKHYLKYALYPWGSNHYMLGIDGKPGYVTLFQERESQRMSFIQCLKNLGIKIDAGSVLEYMKSGQMHESFKYYVRRDKILNDAYRLYVLGLEDFTDNHDWTNLVDVK